MGAATGVCRQMTATMMSISPLARLSSGQSGEHRFKATYTEGVFPAVMMFFLEFTESVFSLYPDRREGRPPKPARRQLTRYSNSSHLQP